MLVATRSKALVENRVWVERHLHVTAAPRSQRAPRGDPKLSLIASVGCHILVAQILCAFNEIECAKFHNLVRKPTLPLWKHHRRLRRGKPPCHSKSAAWRRSKDRCSLPLLSLLPSGSRASLHYEKKKKKNDCQRGVIFSTTRFKMYFLF